MKPIRLFAQLNAIDCFENNLLKITQEVFEKTNDYILNVNVDELKQYFIEKYKYLPITLYPENVKLSLEKKMPVLGDHEVYDYSNKRFSYILNIEIPFIGNSLLFLMKPSTCVLDFPNVAIPDGNSGNILGNIIVGDQNQDKGLVEVKKINFIKSVEANVPNINRDVEAYNKKIGPHFDKMFSKKKLQVLNELQFFESINIDIDKGTDKIFKVQKIEKKKVPEPIIDKKSLKKFTENPVVDDAFYDDVLDSINSIYKSVEKKPSIFSSKDEEALRDYILPFLELRYETSTATGETFNKDGKTDILIKHTNGTNLFIAECKFWKGKEEFFKAINQLFDNYLTWRDSKVALIFFVENKELTKVLETIKLNIKDHPYFVKENGSRSETSLSYIFHFPDDKNKLVYAEIMAFHFPK